MVSCFVVMESVICTVPYRVDPTMRLRTLDIKKCSTTKGFCTNTVRGQLPSQIQNSFSHYYFLLMEVFPQGRNTIQLGSWTESLRSATVDKCVWRPHVKNHQMCKINMYLFIDEFPNPALLRLNCNKQGWTIHKVAQDIFPLTELEKGAVPQKRMTRREESGGCKCCGLWSHFHT